MNTVTLEQRIGRSAEGVRSGGEAGELTSGLVPHAAKLLVGMYACGLSTRDIEDLLGEMDDRDDQSLLSRSSVSGWKEEFACRADA